MFKKFFKKINDLNNSDLINKSKLMKELKFIIKEQVDELFPVLNDDDKNTLITLSIYLHYQIINKFLDINKFSYLEQFTQNNYVDCKAIILMILPFIDDKDNGLKYKKLVDLNQLLYNQLNAEYIPGEILTKDINETLKNEFYFTNFSIGLMDEEDNEDVLPLYIGKDKLIETIIYHNFISLMETLKTINGKLYINWINVEPIVESELNDETIYKNTKKLLENIYKNDAEFRNLDLNYNGLWAGDFYNVMRNGYYRSIKKVKWLIFTKFNPVKSKNQYYLQILNDLFNMNQFLENDFFSYDDLTNKHKLEFQDSIFNLKNIINNTFRDKNKVIYQEIIIDLCKQIFIYIINTYSGRNKYDFKNLSKFKFKLGDDETLIDGKNDDLNDKDNEKFNLINTNDLIEAFNSIDLSIIWEYLKEAIDYFQSTIYGTFLIKDNKINEEFYFIKTNDETRINLKNLYNIAKVLSHSSSWKLRYENFQGFTHEERKRYIREFLSDRRINFRQNIKKETENSDKNEGERLAEIKEDWIKYNIDFVFFYLIRRGLLSKFKPDLKLTNKNRLPSGYKALNKTYEKLMNSKFKENKEKWSNSYYYLTNNKFKNLPKKREKDNLIGIKEFSYFELISEEQKWYKFYAMDWITQIKFFHNYINHQVMYVTGATGQGKSTQVPKLLLYALKMIDYKENGSVICTQPRIGPTIGNATRISDELGVPIKQYSNTLKTNTNSDNFYLQYKYQGGQHISLTKKHLNLRLVTDGTLFEEIKQNQFMKEIIPGKNKNEITYSEQNKYDIIIIDEAHEHNSNMDLILTLAKNTCFFNNSIRLVIVSATMDDDEPIYRSYFKKINDNLVYPIKREIKYNPFDESIENFLPETMYLDRRFHISPPGETTQYKIDEIYLNLPEDDSDIVNALYAQIESYETVLEICRSTSNGEILLFSTGEGEIKQAVEELNKRLPLDVIALPYFSAMNERYKDIVANINKEISTIRNHKNKIHEQWGPKYIEDMTVPLGIYKRSVIIATNVAEASITIPNLQFVIDNGYAKEANFDETNNKSNLEVSKISEASRIQRKGRVGRVGDGTVYYLYKKNARANIKPKYKINQIDFSIYLNQLSARLDKIYSEDKRSFIEEKKLFPKSVNPYNYILFKNKPDNKFFENYDIYKNNYLNIIMKQFTFNGEYLDDIYFNSVDSQNFDFKIYKDGFELNYLFDIYGQFYLIHPKEDKIVRNCANRIIRNKENNKKISEIDYNLFKRMLFNLENKLQIVELLGRDVMESSSDNLSLSKLLYSKTLFSEKFIEFNSVLKLDENLAMTLIYAYGHSTYKKNIFNDVLLIIALLQASDFSLKKLAILVTTKNGYEIPDFDNLKNKFKSNKSDLESLYLISQKLKNYFSKLKIFDMDGWYGKFKDDWEKIKNQFHKTLKNKDSILDPVEFSNSEEWDKLKELKNNGKLNSKSGYQSWLNSSGKVIKYLKDDLKSYTPELKTFCINNNLNFNIIYNSIEKYMELKLNADTIDRDDDIKIIKEENIFEWIDNNYKSKFISNFGNLSYVDKIIYSFLAGNTVKVIYKTDLNINYNLITTKNNIEIEPISKNNPFNYASFLTSTNPLMFFIGLNKKNKAEILTNINAIDLINVNPLYYNPKNFKYIYLQQDKTTFLQSIIELKGKVWDDVVFKIKNNWSSKNLIWDIDDDKILHQHVFYLNNIIKRSLLN